MSTTPKTTTIDRPRPDQIVQHILDQATAEQATPTMTQSLVRATMALEKRTPRLVERAQQAGVEIEPLGTSRLFQDARLYSGLDTDWVMAPASTLDDAIVPRHEMRRLQRLHDAGVDFPMMYIAHEIPKERTRDIWEHVGQPDGPLALEASTASSLVGPVPAPATAVEVRDRLSARSTQMLTALRRGSLAAGAVALGVVAAPVALVGGALAGLATLDPIVIGAIPARRGEVGEPAAFFILARWDW
jgi:hypothetical protein